MRGRQSGVLQRFAIRRLDRRGANRRACGEMYDAAHVWTTVASHARYFPADQGTRVASSGILPYVLNSPAGSRVLGTSALRRARHMMSFIAWWRNDRPWALLHTNPLL